MVYTDASDSGYAGFTVEHGCHIAHGQWLPEEASRSSTWRELRAVRSDETEEPTSALAYR